MCVGRRWVELFLTFFMLVVRGVVFASGGSLSQSEVRVVPLNVPLDYIVLAFIASVGNQLQALFEIRSVSHTVP